MLLMMISGRILNLESSSELNVFGTYWCALIVDNYLTSKTSTAPDYALLSWLAKDHTVRMQQKISMRYLLIR